MPGAYAVWTIVVAAGTGSRFGGPKQFAALGDRRVLDWSVATAQRVSDGVVVVVPPGHQGQVRSGATREVPGGATRSRSVRAGLAVVPEEAEVICVHDAARPFAGIDLYEAVIGAIADGADAAVPGVPLADTIAQVDGRHVVVAVPDRSSLVAVQTPQGFAAAALRRAHAAEPEGTDDASLVLAAGGRVVVVAGHPDNRKLTVPDDLDWARNRVS